MAIHSNQLDKILDGQSVGGTSIALRNKLMESQFSQFSRVSKVSVMDKKRKSGNLQSDVDDQINNEFQRIINADSTSQN